jgi:hypothetical protein
MKRSSTSLDELQASHFSLEAAEAALNSESQLWVDKYRPQSYIDLLTDEVGPYSLLSLQLLFN